MQQWRYDYRKLHAEMDLFAQSMGDVAYSQVWTYTKKMLAAHAEAMRPEDMGFEEALALAWSQFESTFDEDDDEALLSLAGIVIHLVNTVPLGQTCAFNEAIEIGFAMARGFSKAEAVEQLRQQQIRQEVNATHPPYPFAPCLSVVDGDKQQ